jgi:hypothetical protein
MEARITDIQIIYEFTSKDTQTTNGVYFLKFNSGRIIFIRNNDSVGAVQHYWGRQASQCVSLIKDDVKEEFFTELKKLTNIQDK